MTKDHVELNHCQGSSDSFKYSSILLRPVVSISGYQRCRLANLSGVCQIHNVYTDISKGMKPSEENFGHLSERKKWCVQYIAAQHTYMYPCQSNKINVEEFFWQARCGRKKWCTVMWCRLTNLIAYILKSVLQNL